VLGEVGARDASRTLSLRPGRFFVRGRGADYLLEGSVEVGKGQLHTLETSRLTRVAYARLVRKGQRDQPFSHAIEAGASVRTPLDNAETPCWGALLGYRLELENLGVSARLVACTSSFDNDVLSARTDELALSLGVDHTWDFAWLSFWAGMGLGGTLFHQSFDTDGLAPSRSSLAPLGILSLGATRSIGRYYLTVDLRGELYLLKFQETALTSSELRAQAALRTSLAFGVQF
jgi:hypothetical protein